MLYITAQNNTQHSYSNIHPGRMSYLHPSQHSACWPTVWSHVSCLATFCALQCIFLSSWWCKPCLLHHYMLRTLTCYKKSKISRYSHFLYQRCLNSVYWKLKLDVITDRLRLLRHFLGFTHTEESQQHYSYFCHSGSPCHKQCTRPFAKESVNGRSLPGVFDVPGVPTFRPRLVCRESADQCKQTWPAGNLNALVLHLHGD